MSPYNVRDDYADDARSDVVVVPADKVPARPVRWLWKGWLPLGMISLEIGQPGHGKSNLAIELGAQLTRGELPGDLFGRPSCVLIASYEDALRETLKPRLEAANADMSRVGFLACRDRGRVLYVTHQLPGIERIVKGTHPRLLILDPLVAGMPAGEVNSHRDQDVRSVLAPIAVLAERYGLAVLAIGHFPKSAARALLGMGGSVGFSAAARSILVFGLDPKDARGLQGPARVLAHAKCNVGRLQTSRKVSIGAAWVTADDQTIETSVAVLGDECDVTADDLVRADARSDETPRDRAVQFLRELLADGPHPAKEVYELASDDGIARRTLERAKDLLGIESYQQGRSWFWRLPAVEADRDG